MNEIRLKDEKIAYDSKTRTSPIILDIAYQYCYNIYLSSKNLTQKGGRICT